MKCRIIKIDFHNPNNNYSNTAYKYQERRLGFLWWYEPEFGGYRTKTTTGWIYESNSGFLGISGFSTLEDCKKALAEFKKKILPNVIKIDIVEEW